MVFVTAHMLCSTLCLHLELRVCLFLANVSRTVGNSAFFKDYFKRRIDPHLVLWWVCGSRMRLTLNQLFPGDDINQTFCLLAWASWLTLASYLYDFKRELCSVFDLSDCSTLDVRVWMNETSESAEKTERRTYAGETTWTRTHTNTHRDGSRGRLSCSEVKAEINTTQKHFRIQYPTASKQRRRKRREEEVGGGGSVYQTAEITDKMNKHWCKHSLWYSDSSGFRSGC